MSTIFLSIVFCVKNFNILIVIIIINYRNELLKNDNKAILCF